MACSYSLQVSQKHDKPFLAHLRAILRTAKSVMIQKNIKYFTREDTQARQYSERYTRMAAVNSFGISTVAGEITNMAALEDKRHKNWCNRWYRLLLAHTTAIIIHFKEQ